MPSPGRSSPQKTPGKSRPAVVNEKTLARMGKRHDPSIPLRTVIYIEVGNLKSEEVQQAVAFVQKQHASSHHPVFVCPVRNGRLSTDVLFEEDILTLVNAWCEIKDGKIVMKDGAKEVDVLRTHA